MATPQKLKPNIIFEPTEKTPEEPVIEEVIVDLDKKTEYTLHIQLHNLPQPPEQEPSTLDKLEEKTLKMLIDWLEKNQ